MAIWTIAKKDLRLLVRDPRALVILLAMPFFFILVLGVSLGEGFGQKPDDRLRVSIVDLDKGPKKGTKFPETSWAKVVLRDLAETGGIRVEVIETREEAERLVRDGKRAAVLIFGPRFSDKVSESSFLIGGINPFHRDGVNLDVLDITMLRDGTQETAASIMEQVAQGTLIRVVLPWMIGRAFAKISDIEFIDNLSGETRDVKFTVEMMAPRFKKVTFKVLGVPVKMTDDLIKQASSQIGAISLSDILPLLSMKQKEDLGNALQNALQKLFPNYNLTANTWASLTKSEERKSAGAEPTKFKEEAAGLFKRGTIRYQLLVPSYLVMFAFFLVLTVGWLFVAERRQGTLKRLRAAPLSHTQILFGKRVPCFVLSLFQALFLFGAGKLVFGMSWGPEPLWLLPVIVATSLAAMGLSLLIAALAQTETQVAIYGTLVVLILAGLSGTLMGDRSLMPELMQRISLVTPHAWALDAYRQLLASTTEPNLDIVVRACLVLVGFAGLFVFLAWWFLELN